MTGILTSVTQHYMTFCDIIHSVKWLTRILVNLFSESLMLYSINNMPMIFKVFQHLWVHYWQLCSICH